MINDHSAPIKVDSISSFLLLVAVISLAFTAAGTFNLGFPLKAYEIAIGFLFLVYIVKLASSRRLELSFLNKERWAVYLAFAYVLVAICSSIFGYFVLSDFKNTTVIDSWRHDPSVASTLKCGYLFLDVFVFSYIIGAKGISPDRICNYWLIGALFSAFYGWYLFSVSLLGHVPLTLPGQDHLQVGGPFFPQAIRCGTFLEGNYVGAFYLISAVVGFVMFTRTWKIRYGLLGLFFLFSIFHTQSTCAFAAALVFMITLGFLIGISNQRNFFIMIPAFAILTLFALGVSSTSYVQKVLINKVSSDNNDPELATSRLEREDLIQSAYEMFLDYPILGVGLSNFGFLHPYYTHFQVDTQRGGDVASSKTIPNNIYSEVSTETGIVGSITFACFCAYTVSLYRRSARGLEQRVILAGLLSLFVAWLAYPTFSFLFQWVFFALVVRIFLETPPHEPA